MLLRLIRYPYGSVRARAMAGGFHAPGILAEALEDGTGKVAEGRFLPPRDEEDATPLRRLEKDYRRTAETLAAALPAPLAATIRTYLGRLAVENLKLACRSLLLGRPDLSTEELFTPAPRIEGFPSPSRLLASDDLESLSRSLPRGPLREILRRGEGKSPADRLAFLESALDGHFWKLVEERLERLPPLDRGTAREVFGWRADLERFRIVVRGWRQGRDPKGIVATLPALGTAFPPAALRLAFAGATVEESLARLHPVSGLENPLAEEGERALAGRLRRELRKALRLPPVGPGPALAALLLKELEIEDLRGLLGGLRLGRDRQEITSWLATRGGVDV